MNKYVLLIPLIFFTSLTSGQEKHLIYFKDKDIQPGETLFKSSAVYQKTLESLTDRAIERRKKTMGDQVLTYEDLPIKEEYLNQLQSLGTKIVHQLIWFNAVSVYLNDNQEKIIKELPFVEKVEKVKTYKFKEEDQTISNPVIKKGSSSLNGLDYGNSFTQLELSDIPIVHSKGITGEGVILGLLDTGFDWKNHESLASANVIAEYDFVFNDSVTANEPGDASSQHSHGTSVMSEVAGFVNGTLIGASYGSSFLLAKTEYVPTETNVEEDNYAAALIWMENLGVDVTSSSLGYSEFDAGETSYTYQDMDGKTTIVTQACELAFDRGVVTITSAGNEGNSSWFYITAPADGFNTIAVGAVNSANDTIAFSSHGPTSDGRIKPEIVTQGSGVFAASTSGFDRYNSNFGGTSAAAPLACGIAGVLLSAHPHLTNVQVREILIKTADNYSNPDNKRGYGLASAQNAVNYPNFQFENNSYKIHKIFVNDIIIDPATVKLNYTVQGGNFQQVDMGFDGTLRYNFVFPDLNNNQSIEFYFTYNNIGGDSFREPKNGSYEGTVTDIKMENEPPMDFALHQNYPNPFNNQTRIDFTSPANEYVELIIYNVLGQKIKSLFNGVSDTGKNSVNWNGKDENGNGVSSGFYFYSLKYQDKIFSKKMVLLK